MVKQKPVPYTHQDVTFLEDVSLPSTKKKGDTGTAAGDLKRKHTVLPCW